jgi:hypothetical protein
VLVAVIIYSGFGLVSYGTGFVSESDLLTRPREGRDVTFFKKEDIIGVQ